MQASRDTVVSPIRQVATPAKVALQLSDVVVQLALGAAAWLPIPATAGVDAAFWRAALVMWQTISLCVWALSGSGGPGHGISARAIWPLLLGLALGIVLSPFGWGRIAFGFWFTDVQALSLPYLAISVYALFRSAGNRTISRKAIPFPILFRLRQVDFYAQIAILAGAVLVTMQRQRPLQEALTTCVPLLAAWQALSSVCNFCCWRSYARWRSLIRIPYMTLQALFLIGLSIRHDPQSLQLRSVFEQPAAQLLIGSYFLITFLEWDAMDREELRTRPGTSFL